MKTQQKKTDLPPKAIEIKTNILKEDLIKHRSFFTAKETIKKKKMKRQPMEWEKIVANDVTIKSLISKIHTNNSYDSNKQIKQNK